MPPFDDDEDEATMIAHRDDVDGYGDEDEDEATVIARRQDPLPARPAARPAAGRPHVPPPAPDSEATALLVHDASTEPTSPEEDLQRTRIDAPRARPEAVAPPAPRRASVAPHPLSGTAPLGPAERARAVSSTRPPASAPPPRAEPQATASGAYRAQSAIASGPFRAQPGLGSGVPSASLSGAYGAQPGPNASGPYGAQPGANVSGAFGAQPGPNASGAFGAQPSPNASGAYGAQPGANVSGAFGAQPAAPVAQPFGPAAGLGAGPASQKAPSRDDDLVLSTAEPERRGAPAWVVTYVVACAVLSALGVAALVYLKLESYF